MPLTLSNSQVPLDDTTMVIYKSRTPVAPERKRELAKRCGISFIRLLWKENISSIVGVSGFQHVKLHVMPTANGKGRIPSAIWDKNSFTNEPKMEGCMDFVPDEMGTGIAYLPDSPTNRINLAYAVIGKNALWDIDDPTIKKEIDELANEIKNSDEYREAMANIDRIRTETEMRVRERNISSGIEKKSSLEIEVEVLREKVKEAELNKSREELRKRLAKLQGEVIPDSNSPKVDEVESIGVSEGIRKKAKTEVYYENKELIDTVKANHFKTTGNKRGWAFCTDYQRQVKPLIDKKIKELLKENEHSTTGVAA